MAIDINLNQYESRVVLGGTAAPGTVEKIVQVDSGSRMLVTLLVTQADPGASISLHADNSFDADSSFETLETLTLSAPGRVKRVISDFNSLFKFRAVVTGGSVSYKFAVRVFDNSLTTTIENAEVSVDLNHGDDSVSLGDGTTLVGVTLNNELKTKDAESVAKLTSIDGKVATETTAAAIVTAVQSLQSALDSINSNTDGLEGYLDGVEGLLTTIRDNADQLEALLTGIGGYTDGVEALLTSIRDNADQVEASLASIDASLASLDLKTVKSDTDNVTVVASALPAGAATSARQDTGNASLASIDTKTVKSDTDNVTVVSSALPTGAATGAKQDTGNTSLASIDSKVATATKQDTGNTSLASIDSKIAAADTDNVTVISSALPTGAATAARQDTGNTSLASIDTKVATATKQDTGNASLSSIDTKVATAAKQDTQTTALQAIQTAIEILDNIVSGSEAQVDVVGPLPAGTNTIGKVDINYLTVVDFMDNDVANAASTTIPKSSDPHLEVVTSLAANVKKLFIDDTTGKFIGIYAGTAGNEVLKCIAGPGIHKEIEVSLSAGARISIKHLEDTDITKGILCIQFLG